MEATNEKAAIAKELTSDFVLSLLSADGSPVTMSDLLAATRSKVTDEDLVAHYDKRLKGDKPREEKIQAGYADLLRARLRGDRETGKVKFEGRGAGMTVRLAIQGAPAAAEATPAELPSEP